MEQQRIGLTGKHVWYASCLAGGLVGAYLGLSKVIIIILLLLGWAVGFFGPYQVRRLHKYWMRDRA